MVSMKWLGAAVLLLALSVGLTAPVRAQEVQQPQGGGVETQAVGCQLPPEECPPPPVLPAIQLRWNTFTGGSAAVETGPYTYSFYAVNYGAGSGSFEAWFTQAPAMLGLSASPTTFDLAPGDSQQVTVTYWPKGTGNFRHTVRVLAEGAGSEADASIVQPVLVVGGTSILSHLSPTDFGYYDGIDSMSGAFAHPTQAVDLGSLKMWIGSVDWTSGIRTSTVSGQGATIRLRPTGLSAGTTTWTSYGCTVGGVRCDTMRTTITIPTNLDWALDDSLPEDGLPGGFGGVGPLPIPPLGLRGCPVTPGNPELLIRDPLTLIAGQSQGQAFVASYSQSEAVIQLRVTTVVPSATKPNYVCDNPSYFGYIPPSQFNYDWWPTEFWPAHFARYPYSDSTLLYSFEESAKESPESYALNEDASLDNDLTTRWHGPNPGDYSATPRVGRLRERLWDAVRPAPRRTPAFEVTAPTTPAVREVSRASMLPDPGPIDTLGFNVVLNGTPIITNGVATYAGVQLVERWRGGQTWTIPSTAAIVRRYIDATPTANQGGWNELIATIATTAATGAKTTSQRTRWVQGPASVGVGAPTLTLLRDFSKSLIAECPAFGAFQCGSVFVTQGLPGFVSRDRVRGLALVYRSASQRVPTLLPVRYQMDRYHTQPDSLHAYALVDGALTPTTIFRYSGVKGTVGGGVNVYPLTPGASSDRVLGVEIPAHTTAEVAIRDVKVVIKSFYTTPSLIREDTLVTKVVQTYAASASATRFGSGWALAQQQRLHSGLMWGTDEAKVWVAADGSFMVFRRTGSGTWRAPAGVTTRLGVLSTPDDRAKFVLAFDDGTQMGFLVDTGQNKGRLAWTADLVGNRTGFYWAAGVPNKLMNINDPTGARYDLTYSVIGTGSTDTVVTSISTTAAPTGSGTSRAGVVFIYDATTRRLTKTLLYRSATDRDTVSFGYHASTTGAFLTSITDPRSTAANVIDQQFAYDTTLWSPVGAQTPVAKNGMRYGTLYRDMWRRGVPRAGVGRKIGSTVIGPLERLVTFSQFVGTSINLRGVPTDFRSDPFGAATFVRRVSMGTMATAGGGGMYVPGSLSNDTRTITRDAAGRVLKIVRVADVSDSVMYQYDTIYNRPTRVIRATRYFDVGPDSLRRLDTLSFAYDVVALDSLRRCVRLKVSVGEMRDSTKITYGTTGAGQCLPTEIRSPGGESTVLEYGTLAANQSTTMRPIRITDPFGITDSVQFDSRTWNTAINSGRGLRSQAYYEAYGRPDSVLSGIRTAGRTDWSVTRYIYDWLGRVTRSRAGRSALAPASETTYLPGGLVSRVKVYASSDDDGTLGPISADSQVTRYFYDRFGFTDSVIAPGPRTPTREARKQSVTRTVAGDPLMQYPGNGLWVRNTPDWEGRPRMVEQSNVAFYSSADGERFAAQGVMDSIGGGIGGIFSLTAGHHWNAGSYSAFTYTAAGQVETARSVESFTGNSVSTGRSYLGNGAVSFESKSFTNASGDGVSVARNIWYNRRGQRTRVREVATPVGGASLSGDPVGYRKFVYDSLTGRLVQMVAQTALSASDTVPFTFAKVDLTYSPAGRVIRQVVRIYEKTGPSDSLVTVYSYSGLTGRMWGQTTTGHGNTYYGQSMSADGDWNALGDLKSMSVVLPGMGGTPLGESFTFDTTGLRRLMRAGRAGQLPYTVDNTYDTYGNRTAEKAAPPEVGGCISPGASATFGPDNRLIRRTWVGGCRVSYLVDQLGNRLSELTYGNSGGPLNLGSIQRMTYTAGSQLYFSLSTDQGTSSAGDYNANWHFYDEGGMRVHTEAKVANNWFPQLTGTTGTFYVYDGSDVSMTFRRGSTGQGYSVAQRYLVGGVDQPLAVRATDNGSGSPRTLGLVADHQGSTVAAMRPDGLREMNGGLWSRDPFGVAFGVTGGATIDAGTGFAGGSTPNQTGGFTYFRNRWYDPQTGRFLTQDPIGLAGGVNLYAYAGNNPVSYSDPFGLKGESSCLPFCAVGALIAYGLEFMAVAVAVDVAVDHLQGRETDLARSSVVGFSAGVVFGGASIIGRAALSSGAVGEVATAIGSKIEGQMGKRGWTSESIEGTIAQPSRTASTMDTRHLPGGGRMRDPATAYINADESYVVKNNRTGDVVQVSNRNDPNWQSPFSPQQ